MAFNMSANLTFIGGDSNETLVNYTMPGRTNINDICGDGSLATGNSSLCNKSGLGISLSTPIAMLSLGVLGNIIALVVLFTAKKELRRTVFYSLLFGLAWTDLIGQLLVGPIAIIVYANNLKWVGGEPVCKYHAFMMICFGIITPLLVGCMSVERFLALRFTYFHARVVTRTKAKIVMLLCWVFVLTFSSMPLVGFGSYEHQFPGSWCFLNFHRESTSDVAYAYSYAFINVIIISVIIICNTVVIFTLIQMRKTRKIINSPSMERRHGTTKQKSKLKMEGETQMVWFLCAITLVFTTCWFPLNIHILINQVTGRVNYAADLIGVRMASINQILDPWLYILLRKRFIVKGFRLIKSLLTKGKKYESPKRSTRHLNSNHMITVDNSHRVGPVSEAHELNQYIPDAKLCLDESQNVPEKEECNNSSCSDVSDSGSSSTQGLIPSAGSGQLRQYGNVPIKRSISAGSKTGVQLAVLEPSSVLQQRLQEANRESKGKTSGTLAILNVFRKRSWQTTRDEGNPNGNIRHSRTGSLPCAVGEAV